MQCNIDDDAKTPDNENSTGRREMESEDLILLDNLIENDNIELIWITDEKNYENFKLTNEEIDWLECDNTDQQSHVYETECEVDSISNQIKKYELRRRSRSNKLSSPTKKNLGNDDVKRIFGGTKIAKKMFLMQHNVQNNSQIFKCKLCSYKTGYKHNLSTHIKIHENIKDFKCTYCSKAFTQKINLDNHLLNIHNCKNVRKKMYNCDQCSCEYVRKSKLLQHKVKHGITNGIQILKCYQCTFETYNKNNLYRHIKIHKNIKNFKCTYCSKEFIHKNTFEKHLLSIPKCRDVRKKLRLYNCDQCSCNYLTKRDLLQHVTKQHITDSFPVFKCCRCSFETYHKSSLSKHVKIHKKIKDFKCTLCLKQFTQKIHLNKHLLKIHKSRDVKNKLKLYNCDQCSCKYVTKSDLLQHKIKHGITDGMPIFKCSQCTFETYHKSNLIKHVKIHQSIKDFKCTYCSKEFTHKINLDNHLLKIHKYRGLRKKRKLYKCDQCNCNYLSKRDLLQHKVKHGITDGIPIFKCFHCTFETYRKSSLISHVKIHQSIKDFKCTYCSKEFAQKNNLQNHLLRIHKGTTK